LEINKEMITEVEEQIIAFKKGFTRMVPEVFLNCMEYTLFHRSLAGKNEIDLKDLKEVIYFDSFSRNDKTESYFWEVVAEFD